MSKKQRRKKVVCANCKVSLNDNVNFCHNCGQENHDKRASVKMLINDFSQDYFTFDSKLFRSLKPLLFKPGFLTLEFINGKRMNYIKPIRLYLFISFIYFLTNGFLHYLAPEDSKGEDSITNIKITHNNKDIITNKQEILNLIEDNPALREQYKNISEDSAIALFKKTPDLMKLWDKMNNDSFEEKFNNQVNKWMPIIFFILIPLLAILLKLFFFKKKYFYVDYLVFALHYQSLLFLLLIPNDILSFLLPFPSKYIKYTLALILLIYGVSAAKKVFKFNYFSSLLRLLPTLIIQFIVGSIFFGILVTFILYLT